MSADTSRACVARHQEALLLFERGRHEECVRALEEWLKRYESAHAELGASARFFIALSYRDTGKKEQAKGAFLDICRRYAEAPSTEPAAKWRAWAQEELDRLEK